MNRLIQHILSTAVAGVLILIPIGITVFVFFEISDLLMGIVSPIAALLPVKKVAGIDVTYLVSAALIFAGCYLLGQGIRTRFGQRINEWVEGALLSRLPGFSLAKSLTRGIAGGYSDTPFPVALARIHGTEAAVLGLVVERHADGRLTLFVPQAPTPTLGTIYVVSADQVETLDSTATAMLNATMQWGIGIEEMLTPRRAD